MERIIRNVNDIDSPDRRALEHVIGQPLRENQQVIINVVNIDRLLEAESANAALSQDVPEWWKVYDGLSDEEIDRLDDAVRQRANITRVFE